MKAVPADSARCAAPLEGLFREKKVCRRHTTSGSAVFIEIREWYWVSSNGMVCSEIATRTRPRTGPATAPWFEEK